VLTAPASAMPLRSLLVGGDRRSIRQSAAALRWVQADRRRVRSLAQLTSDEDELVVMRATDLLEKLARSHPAWVQPHRALLIGPLSVHRMWEVQLQVVRALPLLRWTAVERQEVVAILRRALAHPKLFVRIWAMDSLAQFALDDLSLADTVHRVLASAEHSTSAAQRARARRIRRQWLARTRGDGQGQRS
jgi:HEAT repeat protein